MLQLDRIRKVYRRGVREVAALDDITLSVPRGQFVSIMGPSGSGKSTLLNLIGCLDTPTSGDLTIDGLNVARLSDDRLTEVRRNRVAIIFQFYNLLPTLTALENTALPRLLAGASGAETTARARELLDRVGLSHRIDHRPEEMSGGEMQRVAIARALMSGASLLLADEPTGNLDSESARSVMELLRRTVAAENLTLVLVTHDPGVAALADRHIAIKDGRIVADDLNPAAPGDAIRPTIRGDAAERPKPAS